MKQITRLTALLLAACMAALGFGAPGKRYALLVGVDEYEQKNFIHALDAAGADAESLGKTLVDVGGFAKDDVRVLTTHSGIAPTNTNILYELEQLSKNVQAGDTVFFFFSGHGIEVGGATYLLPSNTDARSESTLLRSAVPTADIQKTLSKLPAATLVMAFDMCRSDPLKTDRGTDPRADSVSAKQVKDLVLVPSGADGPGPKQVVTFFSCSPGQKSYEWRNQKRGYFSYYFEQALRGDAADPASGEVRVGDLQSFVRSKVAAAVKKNENSDQEPFIKLEGPDPLHLALAWKGHGAPSGNNGGTVGGTGGSVREEKTTATMLFSILDPDGKAIANPSITMDGKTLSKKATLDLEDQRTRDVEITIKADGFKTKILQVTLERGKETPVEVKLEPKPIEEAEPQPSLFPATLGSEWVIRTQIPGQPEPIDMTITVTSVKKMGTSTVVVLQYTANGQVTQSETYIVDADQVARKRSGLDGSSVMNPPLPLMKYPMAVGKSWKYNGKISLVLEGTTVEMDDEAVLTVSAYEAVQTEAGTFKAYRIDMKGTVQKDSIRQDLTTSYWYAPGVGIVKQSASIPGVEGQVVGTLLRFTIK